MPDPDSRQRYSYAVDSPHVLSVKEYGVEDGIPVVFLHGGPGSGCRPSLCELFDLQRFRIIAIDQRGAGDSVPHGCLENNTTQYMLEDLERVRRELTIDDWIVVGGSWGALLAIAYAEAYPARVRGIVVRSLFLGSDDELQRAFITLPQFLYPEIYRAFVNLLPVSERQDTLRSYYARILDSDEAVSLPASFAWHDYERALSELRPALPNFDGGFEGLLERNRARPSTPRMEAHYFSNRCFLEPGQLLEQAPRLAGIPGVIVQSRYDLLCPPITAYRLAERWQGSRVALVESAGHSQADPGVKEAMRAAVQAIT